MPFSSLPRKTWKWLPQARTYLSWCHMIVISCSDSLVMSGHRARINKFWVFIRKTLTEVIIIIWFVTLPSVAVTMYIRWYNNQSHGWDIDEDEAMPGLLLHICIGEDVNFIARAAEQRGGAWNQSEHRNRGSMSPALGGFLFSANISGNPMLEYLTTLQAG